MKQDSLLLLPWTVPMPKHCNALQCIIYNVADAILLTEPSQQNMQSEDERMERSIQLDMTHGKPM